MAKFDAEQLGKRLDELNRKQLAMVEKLSEDLLHAMQRMGPVRAGSEHRQVSDQDRRTQTDSARRQQAPPRRRRSEEKR